MDTSYFTIGMAGHIDHGKTTLTKALTNIDTDRLRAEKERNISIELGFAPLELENGVQASIVDVPGHERFIRQMIAGVAGIDLVVLVIAADEGVMPQTKEHLEILGFLGIERCIVAISKLDQVEQELLEIVEEDIKSELAGSIFEQAPFVYVDSLSGNGIIQLKKVISTELKSVEKRNSKGAFRLPIDQVFTVQGQGTIVRGTIYEGMIQKGSQLTIMPKGHRVKARQIQVHNKEVDVARAGQRTAINLGGGDKETIQRGDVLVNSDHFLRSKTIDVTMKFVDEIASPLKQRSPVRLYIGTSEVLGKIVFFDRNEMKDGSEEVVCQIRLEEEIVIRRGDRFILRRPTPVETLGGGWVIQPNGGKYRFGEKTIKMLQTKKAGTPEDLIQDVLSEQILLDKKKLIQLTSLDETEIDAAITAGLEKEMFIEPSSNKYALTRTLTKLKNEIIHELESYQEQYPMRQGMGKAELIQLLGKSYPKTFIDYCLSRLIAEDTLYKPSQFIAVSSFQPHLPKKWETRMKEVIKRLEDDGIKPEKWKEYIKETPLSEADANELSGYLLHTKQVYQLTEDILIHQSAVERALTDLKEQTGSSFKLNEAKDALGISRKYLIPLLELLDRLNITTRQEDVRVWN
ncbi:selenocysteine-specific translation elongation factor [Virgibacillus necropolis]|uniref:Selenocysteine-specific elongation factor n=1 Tax=Virgibacillus necropolis TaxID=163877 RepID=A0A221MAX9_9BACI|nr:selenocysteine-specific translation elongation factor [Virgibacillus necropolis]ASN04794.1 selenocysteine-specific translation elongation factor [Virgibacillus necropolis]